MAAVPGSIPTERGYCGLVERRRAEGRGGRRGKYGDENPREARDFLPLRAAFRVLRRPCRLYTRPFTDPKRDHGATLM